jgi:drug/metabolite transporter (DMT)-like permease
MSNPALRNVPLKAVLLMIGSVTAFSTQDAALKWLVDGYSMPQVLFFGRILAMPLALFLAMRAGGIGTLATRRPLAHAWRGLCTVTTMTLFIFALKLLPLADAIAIGFASPLFCTALSVPLLKERVGPRRWAAVFIGLCGVLVILQPSGTGFGVGALAALGSCFAYAFLLIASRAMSATESVPCLMFWNAFTMFVVMGGWMIFDWRTPTGADIYVFCQIAVIGAIGQYLVTAAFRHGEVSLLVPIEYLGLVWATALGYILWSDIPTLTVFAGAAIIIASSAYIIHRETRQVRRDPPETHLLET